MPATHYACYTCRKAFKSNDQKNIFRVARSKYKALCPQCGKEMTSMGCSFRAPKQSDIKGWKKVKELREKYGYFTNHFAGSWPKRVVPWHGNKNNTIGHYVKERISRKDRRKLKNERM